MTVLWVAGLGVALMVCLIAIGGLFLPRRWRVERSTRVRAVPATIYPLIANFPEGWRQWSPFGAKQDPTIEMVFSGPSEGLGATQSWKGKRTPAGRMSIVEADRDRSVRYVMEAGGFRLMGRLVLAPQGDHTTVTWSDEGELANPLFRYFGLFADRAVGRPFETGLTLLKQVAEASATPPAGSVQP